MKPHAIHISNREMKLEEEQAKIIRDYEFELLNGHTYVAEKTLETAAMVNAEYAREQRKNAAIAFAMLNEFGRDLLIQGWLS